MSDMSGDIALPLPSDSGWNVGLRSGSAFSDYHSQTGTCPKAQDWNTEWSEVVTVTEAEGPACLCPEEEEGEEARRLGSGSLRGFPRNRAVDFFCLIQRGK